MSAKLTWECQGQWDFRIEFSDATRLKGNGFDLLDPQFLERLKSFFNETVAVIEFISELCRPQWEAKGLKYEAFADLLIGGESTFAEATDVLVNSLTDFFQRTGRRAVAAVVDRAWKAAKLQEEAAAEKVMGPKMTSLIDAMRTKLDQDFDAAIAETQANLAGEKSGESPASSESIPPDGPCEN